MNKIMKLIKIIKIDKFKKYYIKEYKNRLKWIILRN